jgi:hypothetical protein
MQTVTKYLIIHKGRISSPNVNKHILYEHKSNIFEYLMYKSWRSSTHRPFHNLSTTQNLATQQ